MKSEIEQQLIDALSTGAPIELSDLKKLIAVCIQQNIELEKDQKEFEEYFEKCYEILQNQMNESFDSLLKLLQQLATKS